jgi:Cu(I)/Ag(I) efflux system membrane fusion protein
MTRRIAWTVVIVLGFAGALAAGYWLGTRGTATAESPQAAAAGSGKEQRKLLYYRNPMGLPDTSPVPKKDPMGMDYIPVYEGEEPVKSGTVKVSPDKMQLLGVRTEAAARRELRRTVQAVGTIQVNERLLHKVTPRFEGYIERLHVNTTGQAVKRGEPLMEVYSPEIFAAQEEYLIAQAGGPEPVMQRMAEAALQRLRNWGIAESELERLRKEAKARHTLTLRSPAPGVVLSKASVQGMRFMPGETLYEIADLSSVWLVAEVFERDLGLVKAGQPAKLRIVTYPEREFTGKVVFAYPTLDPATRTARVRIELANAGGLLKPAMYGHVELAGVPAPGKALAIPDSAVLDSGSRQVVLVQRAEGQFEPRDVKLGVRADGFVEVLEGVAAGEQVVVRANFLIDAESNLKAALDGFGKAGGPVHRGEGTVEEIDLSAGKLTIDHGAIASLNWPAMIMEFKAKDSLLLKGLKPGQRIEFEFSEQGGEYLVERLKAAPGHAGHGG